MSGNKKRNLPAVAASSPLSSPVARKVPAARRRVRVLAAVRRVAGRHGFSWRRGGRVPVSQPHGGGSPQQPPLCARGDAGSDGRDRRCVLRVAATPPPQPAWRAGAGAACADYSSRSVGPSLCRDAQTRRRPQRPSPSRFRRLGARRAQCPRPSRFRGRRRRRRRLLAPGAAAASAVLLVGSRPTTRTRRARRCLCRAPAWRRHRLLLPPRAAPSAAL